MKITNDAELYLKIQGKFVKITAIFTDDNYANKYMEANHGEGVISIADDTYILIGDCNDKGVYCDK